MNSSVMNLIKGTSVALLVLLGTISCTKELGGSGKYPAPGNTFTEWPSYNPTIHYNFLEENPGFKAPTKNLPYSGKTSMIMESEWWSFFAGPKKNALVTEAAIEPMFKKLNEDFAYLRDEMGWPPDYAAQNGYRSAVFLYGSGLSTDNASNTEKGGWQSAITIGGKNYPMILASYYPVYCFDPNCPYTDKDYNTNAMVHEGIHAVFATLPGCKKSAWFHEGSNCWLQATLNYERSQGKQFDAKSFGWLCMGNVLAPFIPIECYSGWLTDGSFGGPSAEGVHENFREIIGGVQYSEIFPTFLGEVIDEGSVAWVWINCKGRVLEGIAEHIGEEQMRRMIREYRAKLCLADFGRYTNGILNLYNTYMGNIIGSDVEGVEVQAWKATPYVSTTDSSGFLIPEERTLPGWSGANIIPIKVNGDRLSVEFVPRGENMSCQLCYRTADGLTVYGDYFDEGQFTIDISKHRPVNDVVFAVICNTDYIYVNDKTRRAKFDYRLKISENAKPANIHEKWFNWK